MLAKLAYSHGCFDFVTYVFNLEKGEKTVVTQSYSNF
jgi:hypothetical protein